MISENFDTKNEPEPIVLAKKLIKEKLDLDVIDFSIISRGYGGQVIKLETTDDLNNNESETVIFKLSELAGEPDFEKISNGDRIYGSRLSNLIPAYNLIRENNIPVAKIFVSGVTTLDGTKKHYSILEFLPGISVREFLTESKGSSLDGLHAATGEAFGKINNIRRDYQGWTEMKESQSIDWEQSFFDWIKSYLDQIKKNNLFNLEKITAIERYIQDRKQTWTNPSEFVLSHMDGFQGMAEQNNSKWKITGIIDIEDHQFMDQRMALAGHEIVLELEEKKLPEVFWNEYKKNTSFDESYHDLKHLFMLSYLLAWRNIFQNDWHGKQEDRNPAIEKVTKLINEIVK